MWQGCPAGAALAATDTQVDRSISTLMSPKVDRKTGIVNRVALLGVYNKRVMASLWPLAREWHESCSSVLYMFDLTAPAFETIQAADLLLPQRVGAGLR
jgi:hypothetical protein